MKITKRLKGNVSRSLSKLITHKIVIKIDNKLRLNKNYKKWISFSKLSKQITNKKLSELISPVIRTDTKVIRSEGNKRHYTKDTNTKDTAKHINYLLNNEQLKQDYINKDFKGINVNLMDITRKARELYDYCQAKGKKYRNYRSLLRNTLIKDFDYTFKS